MTLDRTTFPSLDTPPSVDTDIERILEGGHGDVDGCLPFSGMTAVPSSFDRFARGHFHRLQRRRLRALNWPDVCPAYALAWLTHAAYGPDLDATSEWELQLQWQDLQGMSNLQWAEARGILRDAWAWLTLHERCTGWSGAA